MAGALDGIVVLDLSRVLAGPWCTQTLADLGAEVWKVEPPQGGDDTRSWMPPEIGGESTYFVCCNRNKKSVALDLKSVEGREAAIALAARADVFIENFKQGTLDRFGLGYEKLRDANPGLIYCSISGYGRTGPRAAEPGYDFSIQAESGLMSITGVPDGEPMKLGVAITDLITGMNATQAILAALFARQKSGRGQFIDISLFESAVAILANVASAHLATGAMPRRFGNAHATVVPYQLFDTADGRIALAVGNDSQFRALCQHVIGQPALAEDARFATNRERVLNREILIPRLEKVFRHQSTGHWIEVLKQAGVPAGQVRNVEEVFASPEVDARQLVVEMADPRHGRLRFVRSPLGLSETPPTIRSVPPRLGQHTEEVMAHIRKG